MKKMPENNQSVYFKPNGYDGVLPGFYYNGRFYSHDGVEKFWYKEDQIEYWKKRDDDSDVRYPEWASSIKDKNPGSEVKKKLFVYGYTKGEETVL